MLSKFIIILRSLIHYKRANLTIILGVAISAMVLTGTLIVGDSVDHSLAMTAELISILKNSANVRSEVTIW